MRFTENSINTDIFGYRTEKSISRNTERFTECQYGPTFSALFGKIMVKFMKGSKIIVQKNIKIVHCWLKKLKNPMLKKDTSSSKENGGGSAHFLDYFGYRNTDKYRLYFVTEPK